jgi:DNA (cytosine-5)-methyltransferase 1
MRLLVTPTVSDATGPGRTRPSGRGCNLRTQIALTMAPPRNPDTPTTPAGKAPKPGEESPSNNGAPPHRDPKPALLPTPLAGNGAKGSPRQRGSKGDLTLPSAIAALDRNPTTRPNS